MVKASQKNAPALSTDETLSDFHAKNGLPTENPFFESIEVLKNEFMNISRSFESISRVLYTAGVLAASATTITPSPSLDISSGQHIEGVHEKELHSPRDRSGRVNAFTIYYAEIKASLEKAHNNMSSKEIYKEALELWKQESDETKKTYSLKAIEVNQAKFPDSYNAEHKKRKKTSTPTPTTVKPIPSDDIPVIEEPKEDLPEQKDQEIFSQLVIESAEPISISKKKNKKKVKSESYFHEQHDPLILPIYEESDLVEPIITEPPSIPKSKKNKSSSKSKSTSQDIALHQKDSVAEPACPSTPVNNTNADENITLSQEDWNVMQHLMFNKKTKKGKHAEPMSSD